MNSHNLRRGVLVGGMALAAALALVVPSGAGNKTPAKADTPADSAMPCGGNGPCTGPCGAGYGHGPHGMGMGPGMGMGTGRMGGGPLVMALGSALDQAKLTEAQKSTLAGLRKQADQARDDARAKFESTHSDFEAELAKSEPDLHALASKMSAAREEMRKSFDGIRDGYLSLYDGLDADQKKEVVTALRSHVEQMKKMREQWKGGPHGKGGPVASPEDG